MADQYGNNVDDEVWIPFHAVRKIGPALALDPPSAEFEERLRSAKKAHAQLEHPAVLDGPEHVITGGRQEGKTRLALKWLVEAPEGTERVLVVLDEDSANHLKSDQGWKRSDPRIVGFRRLQNQGARKGVEYGIDETVIILSQLLGLKETPRLVTIGHAESWQTGQRPAR
jgi:hypothetical protein